VPNKAHLVVVSVYFTQCLSFTFL